MPAERDEGYIQGQSPSFFVGWNWKGLNKGSKRPTGTECAIKVVSQGHRVRQLYIMVGLNVLDIQHKGFPVCTGKAYGF